MKNFFPSNLKYLRELKGWSQSELARQTIKTCEFYNSDNDKIKPITQGSIARWEANENSPSIDNIVVLSKTLKVPLPDLISKNLKMSNNNQKKNLQKSKKKKHLNKC